MRNIPRILHHSQTGVVDHPLFPKDIALGVKPHSPTTVSALQPARPRIPTRALRLNLWIALLVWTLWLRFGGKNALNHLMIDRREALTTVFGAMVGGLRSSFAGVNAATTRARSAVLAGP
jgi:hypothetical protein